MEKNSKGYDARIVANTIIDLAADDGKMIDHLKLQKLIYIAHGWYLANFDAPLFKEVVEAWPYGPVVPAVYHEWKNFKNGPISDYYLVYDPVQRLFDLSLTDEADRVFLDAIWRTYGKYSGSQLVDITHKKGAPWHQVYNDKERSAVIDNKIIKEYYDGLLKELLEQDSKTTE